jgi:hypothetical protein
MDPISSFGNDRGGFAARPSLLSFHMERLPTGALRSRAKPSWRPAPAPKTFTTTLFALAIDRNQIVPDASAQKYMPSGYTLRAQQLTRWNWQTSLRERFELRTEDPIACAL